VSETVVLCGSLGSTAELWAGQLGVLDGRRVVAVDYPGHGGAPVGELRGMTDLAERVLAEVGAEPFSLVGVSLGGCVGMRLALDVPDQVERLVLAFTSPRFGEPAQWHDRAALVREGGLAEIVDAVIARWFTPAFPDAERYRAMFLSVDPEGYAQCCEALADWDVRADLGRIAAPVLVVSGSEDPSTPPEVGRALAAAIPDARFEVIRDGAHLANVERPDDFNQLLEAFL
jgi:3-oxoadipate enol-lactonase